LLRAEILAKEKDGALKGGLYALIPPNQESKSDITLCMIFWPEDTTWDDDSPLSVAKNRVTFMQFVFFD